MSILSPKMHNIYSDIETEIYKFNITQQIDNNVTKVADIAFSPDSCWNCCVGKGKKYCHKCGVARYCHIECRNIARHSHRDSCAALKEYVMNYHKTDKIIV